MTTKTTASRSSAEQKFAQRERQEATSKNWFTRRLWPSSRSTKASDHGSVEPDASIIRPHTAPSTRTALRPLERFDNTNTLKTPLPTRPRPPLPPPPRPPRLDTGLGREVNEWLDASDNRPSPPLMGGLPYWREATPDNLMSPAHMQYAISLSHRFEAPASRRARSAASSSTQDLRSFCRRAKKVQVRMPTLLKTKSQKVTVVPNKQPDRRASVLSRPPIPAQKGSLQASSLSQGAPVLTKNGSGARRIPLYDTEAMLGPGPGHFYCPLPARIGNHRDGNLRPTQSSNGPERKADTAVGHSIPPGNTLCPSTMRNRLPSQESFGNLSDAPSYFTGPPPPSYRSRTASIVTTSSFGCIDGMRAENRNISSQRVAHQSRGVRGKIKKLVNLS
ncbi:hypothetical protein BU24DRAFT_75964 [Aaosphaeria arxii CBS 175.79]|uniref:Uncharacterized protein n=1 Tax=Aaosphaeria arxii CBS 175.79 TaxID=1450172 RepID=A0A6A5X9B8_9PLEO|nr:uncharacterized protein BU24DRAFT_75964 [Aaosphaeria arxii CBS 175.79]KAF2009499.1 hypothetical protein BU24DRAFT_75964 [Aaosphaeria arxii CBS 175.79]